MDDAARARLEGWKLSLLDLSSENRLLDARDGKTIISLPDVDPVRIAFALASGSSLSIDPSDSAALEPGRLRVALGADELSHRLTAIRRTAKAQADDCGVHALWLGLGLLHYDDRVAPLALWPIELEDDRLISAGDRELRLNHTLAAVLRHQLQVVLPEGNDLSALLAAAEAIALTRPGWRVERSTVLGSFSFANLTMWSDATDALLARPLVEKIAARAGFAPLGAVSTDVIAPLDADQAQLAAIAAAGAGSTIVVQGPPGTGKSQTIANLIVHAATQGKSILFVTEKTAALEIVRQRLAAVGLGELCLPLGGDRETIRTRPLADSGTRVLTEIHAALSRVLDRTFRPGSGPSGQDARLAELRLALDGFVAAFHKVGPFGRSVHEALGRLVELRTSPRAELSDTDAIALDKATFDRRKVLAEQLSAAAIPVEPVATHPWRASTLERWAADQRALVAAALAEAQAAVADVARTSAEVIALIPGAIARTAKQLEALGALGALAATSPRPGAEILTQLKSARGDELGERIALIRARGTGTIEVPRDPSAFLAVAQRHRTLLREVEDRFTSAVADLDAHGAWTQLRKWTGSVAPLRFVALRATRDAVRAAAMPGGLVTDDAMIVALESVIAERACRAALMGAAEPAKRWFGDLGGDPLTLELEKIDGAVGWSAELRRAFDAIEVSGNDAARTSAWRALVAQVAASSPSGGDSVELPTVFARLADAVGRWQRALDSVAQTTAIPRPNLADGADHLATLREQLETLTASLDGLRDWATFHATRRAALAGGLGPAVPAIERGDIGAAELADAWERATLLAWADAELAEQPALAEFHGPSHHAHVAAFADLDRGALALARARALVRLAERMPRNLKDPGEELAALIAELRTPTLAPRALLASIPTLLSRIAPCIQASPFDVAQLLDPAIRFDLVVFDEASQLPMSHALGALGRAESAIIVGDSQQLEVADSVLAQAIAAGVPQLALGTHYRSKHEDLIARSNARYYANKLAVYPAAQPSPDLGIAWRRVDREAEAVVGEALARLRDPGQRGRSIAIVTFSTAQLEQIEDLLDDAALVLEAGQEPILVKHVDHVQGDERDIVLVALGNGEHVDARRLNVATTRAREQMIIFSTIAVEDATGELGELLAFAQAGGGASRGSADDQAASPVTAAIARTLVERGWIVRHRVGCGAYRLDLAVVDPNDAERYILAIEHDGSAYASAPAARDRDRLRAQVLGQLGWRMHRVWSFDWWADPEREIQRAHGAIVAALAASRQRRAPIAPARPVVKKVARGSAPVAAPISTLHTADTAKVLVTIENAITLASGSGPAAITDIATAPVKIAKGAIAIGPYLAAAIPAGRRAPDDMFAPRHASELGKVVEQVLAAEAPMHVDRLARRVGAYFGIGRLSQRVTDQVRSAVTGRGRYGEEQNIVWRNDQDPASIPSVRVAGAGPEAKREIEEVPLAELAAAARIVVERASATGSTELVRDVARLLGIARITDKVTERVAHGIRIAAQRELIRVADGRATMPPV